MDDLERLPDEDELAERGRLLIAAAVAQTRAPLALRERLEADRAAPARPRRRLRPFAWAAGALAAVALVAVLATAGGGGGDPSVLAVARAATAAPTAPAPRAAPGGYLTMRVGDVRFPDWRALRWPATGRRTDRVDGRTVQTVVYTARDGTVARYSVVDGAALDVPATARERRVDGTTYRVLETDGDRIVTWERGGRTCVLRAPDSVPEARLVGLAAWEPA